jgi:hypothetical protein
MLCYCCDFNHKHSYPFTECCCIHLACTQHTIYIYIKNFRLVNQSLSLTIFFRPLVDKYKKYDLLPGFAILFYIQRSGCNSLYKTTRCNIPETLRYIHIC